MEGKPPSTSQHMHDHEIQEFQADILESGHHLFMEWAIRDPSDHRPAFPHNCHATMPSIKNEAGDVLLWHVGQLPAENVLQRQQPAKSMQP